MPSKVSKPRSQISKNLSHKSSAQTLNPHVSNICQNLDAHEESPNNELRTHFNSIFTDAQRNNVGHRKLAISLRKIQEACCYEPSSKKKSRLELHDFDEKHFKDEFIRCILRVIPVKKSEIVGDRVIRFIGLFLRLASEKDHDLQPQNDDAVEILMTETPSTRLLSHIINTISPLTIAKDKIVRYRSTQLISYIVNSLDAIDDDVFKLVQHILLRRIYDKESIVRVQAILGLGRLASNDVDGEVQDDDDDNDGQGLLQKLLNVLQNDPVADVRKSLLVNLPILPVTLPFLLERARDQDASTRRALYSRLLPTLGDFRHLSLSMREKLLRWGLRDRDEPVRKATHNLFRERWIDDCASSGVVDGVIESEANKGSKHPNFEALLELLERIDVVNSGIEGGVALDAMKGFWSGRPDYTNEVSLDENFWNTLSAESIFMVRTLNDFYRTADGNKCRTIIEEKLPEVTKLAFYLERYIQVLLEALKRTSAQVSEKNEDEEDTMEQEFIVEQLLHIAQTLDYSDEVGRRKMFALLRQSLSIPDLPEEVTKLIVETLRIICTDNEAGEREFCSVVLEAVADVHDTIITDDSKIAENDDESFYSAKSEISSKTITNGGPEKTEEEDQEQAIREIMINIKCLHIVQCMLENVEGNLQQNADLVAMLNNLVVPAVRSHEAPVRERGLLCLGLCSLLDKSLAEENLTLFMHFFTKGHPALQMTALKILTDILSIHGSHLLDSNPALLKVYLKALKSGNKTPEVQAVAILALAKLILGQIISTSSTAIKDFLRVFIIIYFDPATAYNQSVRQTLSYFLPAYSYSCKENQDRIRTVALDALHKLFEMREIMDDDNEVEMEMVSLATIGAQIVDWTDPRKCFVNRSQLSSSNETSKNKACDGDVHLQFAKDILVRLDSSITREEKKSIATLLSKLHISPGSSTTLLRETYSEVCDAIDGNLIQDVTGRNALYKIHVSLGKIVNGMRDSEASDDLGSSVSSNKSHEDTVCGDASDEVTVLPTTEVAHDNEGADINVHNKTEIFEESDSNEPLHSQEEGDALDGENTANDQVENDNDVNQ